MATHSSALAWRIPGTGKPGGLPSRGSHRVGHNWSDFAAAAAASPYNLIQKGCLPHGTTGRLPIIFYWGGNLKWFMVHACSNLYKDSTDYNTYRTTDDSKSQLQCVNWLSHCQFHCYFCFNWKNITKCFAFHFQPKCAILIPIIFFWIKTFNLIEV